MATFFFRFEFRSTHWCLAVVAVLLGILVKTDFTRNNIKVTKKCTTTHTQTHTHEHSHSHKHWMPALIYHILQMTAINFRNIPWSNRPELFPKEIGWLKIAQQLMHSWWSALKIKFARIINKCVMNNLRFLRAKTTHTAHALI